MKPYTPFLALMVAVAAFIGMIAAIEAPRKPKSKRQGTVHVLPLVEDMYTKPNTLQF